MEAQAAAARNLAIGRLVSYIVRNPMAMTILVESVHEPGSDEDVEDCVVEDEEHFHITDAYHVYGCAHTTPGTGLKAESASRLVCA